MPDSSLILASASVRRLDLLLQIGIKPFAVCPADIDETPRKGELPLPYVKRMALTKAQTVAAIMPEKAVLAADTVVFCGRRILPKVEDEATARQCLSILSGRRHRVATAVALVKKGIVKHTCVMTQVQFRRLTPVEIQDYIVSGEWHGKAGGYAIQGVASAFIPRINGSYSNVVGLPLCETQLMLEAMGIK